MVTHTFLQEGKRLAFSDEGSGQPVVLVPGLGDLKESYRFLVPQLVARGFRAICLDVRGHGESEGGWDDYSVVGVGRDVIALIEHLKLSRVHYVGNSMAAGAGVWAAVEAPQLFQSATFVGPFYHGKTPPLMKLALAPLFWRPWGVSAWLGYYTSLFPTRKPADFAEYTAMMKRRMKEPGHRAATAAMMFASKEASGARAARYQTPTLVIMGSRDPDFPKPLEEAERAAQDLRGAAVLIEGAGHYPQSEFPDETLSALLGFWNGVKT